ncbi:MAG TPA: archease [Actinobacteria bacterium]|nr:archease [Actinomycetota bacterium]
MRGTGFEEIEHPSDIRIKFNGKTMEELFENAGLGMFSMITDLSKIRAVKKIKISLSVESSRPEDLLVIWLEKILYYFEVEDMIFLKFDIKKIVFDNNGANLSAEISGEKADNKRHSIINMIKAPTYHLLNIREDKKKHLWNGKVIFDV